MEESGCKDFSSLLGYEYPKEVATLGSEDVYLVSTLDDSGYDDTGQVQNSYYTDYRDKKSWNTKIRKALNFARGKAHHEWTRIA